MLIFIFLIQMYVTTIFASEELTAISAPTIEATISPLIDGCVNVITGEYIECSQDLVVAGPEPLVHERFYASSDVIKDQKTGWRHHLKGLLKGDKEANTQYISPNGYGVEFIAAKAKEGKKKKFKEYKIEKLSKGSTNCTSGIISARTNFTNTKLIDKGTKDELTIITPEGGTQRFEKTGFENYLLKSYRKMNRLRTVYNHKEDLTNSVELCSQSREQDEKDYIIFSSIKLDWSKLVFKGSNGQKVKYVLDGHNYITEVERKHAPLEKYEYQKKEFDSSSGKQISAKRLPEGRFREIEYFKKKECTHSGKDVRVDRVKSLKSPLGTRYTFKYGAPSENDFKNLDKEKIKHPAGWTDVFDALQHKTTYHYNKTHQIEKICRYTGTDPKSYQLHSTEEVIWWGNPKIQYECRLVAQKLNDALGKCVKQKHYTYDSFGNIIKECVTGNITGTKNNDDSYHKTYTYDTDHLLTLQKEDNGCGVRYSYYPGSDLIASKLVEYQGEIKQRTFYDYDFENNSQTSALICTTIDNGISADRNDVSNVTQRHITRIKLRTEAPYGYPQETSQYYFDPSKGQEVLLSKTQSEYSQEGLLTKQRQYDCHEVFQYELEWRYDAHGNVIWEKDALGQVTERKYNEVDELIEERKPTHTITYQIDLAGRIESKTTSNSYETNTTTYKYDLLNNVIATTDCSGNVTHYGYDAFNRVTKVIFPIAVGAQAISCLSKEYDIFGNVSKEIDQKGNVTHRINNIYGKPLEIHYPEGTVELFEYNTDGTIAKTVAKNGLITKYTYDYQGRETKRECFSQNNLLLSSVTNVYDAFHLLSTTDALGYVTNYRYDPAGRLISMQKGNQLTTYSYDSLGRQNEICEWDTPTTYRKTIKTYDFLNRIIKEVVCAQDKMSSGIEYKYDGDGNVQDLMRITNQGESHTYTMYNSRKQPLRILDAEGNMTVFQYNYTALDSFGNRVLEITQTDPNGMQTITTHNVLNLVAQIIKKDRMGQIHAKQQILYDLCGNKELIKSHVIVSGKTIREITTHFEYNADRQVVKITEAENTSEQRITSYCYNQFGQKENIIKPDGIELLHSYDAVGRLNSIKSSDGTIFHQYQYDLNNTLIAVLDVVSGTLTLRKYDQNLCLIQEVLATGHTLKYTYDKLSRPIVVTLPDQSTFQYEYDPIFLKNVTRLNCYGTTQYQHTYCDFDYLGNPLKSLCPGKAGQNEYQYDIKGRLKKLDSRAYQEVVSYDSVGNVKTRKINQTPFEYEYDPLNQLKKEKEHTYTCDSLHNCVEKDGQECHHNALNQLLSDGKASYLYDACGRLVTKCTGDIEIHFEYDALDRLIAVVKDNVRTTYAYDPFNRRLSKVRGDIVEEYLYQGQNEIGMMCNGKICQLRLLGIGKGAEIGASVAFELENTIFVPTHDHRGNVVSIQNLDGIIQEKYSYSAYKQEEGPDNSINPWRFSSKRVDEETGFVYFGRRYYDPESMRWITTDPLGYEAGPNLYAYVSNNPLINVDLYGLIARANQWQFKECPNCGKAPDYQTGAGPVRNFFTWAGRCIHGFGHHFLPIPIVGEFVKTLGHLVAGQRPGCQNFMHEPHSQASEFTKEDGILAGFINGINTNLESVKNTAHLIGNTLGIKVGYCWNATHSFLIDSLEYALQRFSFRTHSVEIAVQNIKNLLEKADASDIINLIAHSQGAQILYNALFELTPEERARLRVFTFGGAKMIFADEFGLAKAENYVCTRDPVPLLDLFGLAKGIYRNDESVQFIKSNGKAYFDHGFSSNENTYIQHLHKIKHKFG